MMMMMCTYAIRPHCSSEQSFVSFRELRGFTCTRTTHAIIHRTICMETCKLLRYCATEPAIERSSQMTLDNNTVFEHVASVSQTIVIHTLKSHSIHSNAVCT